MSDGPARVAAKALEYVAEGHTVGLGTGRAATAFVHALGARCQAGLRIRGVPTSQATADLATRLGIPLVGLEEVDTIDETVDGADAVDPNLDMIKGYGGALVREKIVAAASRRMIVVIGPGKEVPVLGQQGPVPVEVVPFAAAFCRRQLEALGLRPELRLRDGQPYVTDNHCHILDCGTAPITDPGALDAKIRAIPGVLGTGLFVGMASVVLVEDGEGVRVRERGKNVVMSVKIAPSILAADFSHLAAAVQEAERAGADRIHFDVMDGHFVPNISIGPVVMESLRPVTKLPLEAHLMITDPDRYAPDFAKAGANSLLVHQEGNPNLHRTVHLIRSLGVAAGVVINPATPAALIEPILPDVSLVLLMTVNPGFGGQQFIASVLPKITEVRAMIDRLNPGCDLEVDGGIELETARRAVAAGANVLVAGSAVFRAKDGIAAAIRRLQDSDR